MKIRGSGSLSILKMNLNFMQRYAKSIFDIYNPYEINLVTRLSLGLSHPRDNKFKHHFQDTVTSLCDCGNNTETITHFFLTRPRFHTPKQTFLNNIRNINEQILFHGEDKLIQTFLRVNPNGNLTFSRLILNATIEYLILTERFKYPLFN